MLSEISQREKDKYHIPHLYVESKTTTTWDFPGGPVVNTLPSSEAGAGLIPGRGAEIPHASWPKNQNMKQKQYCNKFSKDLKNGPHPKK